ncbi:hypothetical protein BJ165DRAFT_770795 [Panaeolus papilionaceus]|nr:hypothetical protein BJ165DRAFT_770795 [Panaeolus papilionaceus]
MGPTGSGKSSFIEAFAGESQKLSISKDQLAGYTQTVTAYRLVNVVHAQSEKVRPVYLIDTPGFSDSKISEIEILNMVKKWSQDNKLYYSGRIIYLIPITQTRLPGSRRRTLAMLKRLWEDIMGIPQPSLIIITTMWDNVHNEQTRQRAECNFVQLRGEISKEFVNNPSTDVIKFMNTRHSALLALNRQFLTSSFFIHFRASKTPNLYQDLHERIQSALRKKENIELDLAHPEVHTNANLKAVLERNWRENHKTLTKFIEQFDNFGDLPLDCVEAAQELRMSIEAANVCLTTKPRTLFRIWKMDPVFCLDRSSDGTVQARLSNDTADLLKDRGRLALDASKHCVTNLFKHGERGRWCI